MAGNQPNPARDVQTAHWQPPRIRGSVVNVPRHQDFFRRDSSQPNSRLPVKGMLFT